MTKIIVDASAWLEYFEDTEKGKAVAKMIESTDYEVFTPMSVIAEVIKITLQKTRDPEVAIEGLQQLSSFVSLTMESSVNAAYLYSKYRTKKNSFGMLDAFVVASAREIGAKILTFDNAFRQFKETIIPS
ncbi:MAG: PIN domain-containing protein [Nanoarchaeota archaeon]|nr:PIN domain-containing protein [Nanoarchaeota archaeon]